MEIHPRPRALCRMYPANTHSISQYKSSLQEGFLQKFPKHSKSSQFNFSSKTKHPMKFHERGYLITNLNSEPIEEIKTTPQLIDFSSFLNKFESQDEIKNLDVNDIFGVDAELLTNIVSKCKEFIDASSYFANNKENSGQNEEAKSDYEFMNYLTAIMSEINETKINLEIINDNIDKIKSLQYDSDGVKIYFKKNNENN
jgi:hypothetical protein